MFIIEFIGTFVCLINNKQIESKCCAAYISPVHNINIVKIYLMAYKTLIKTPHSLHTQFNVLIFV